MSANPNAQSSGFARLLNRVVKIESHEIPAVVTAFCLFFCVFAGYFAVRPVRETIGTVLGRERVSDLFWVTWAASLAIIPLYGYLIGKFRRSLFLPWVYGSIAVALAGVGVALSGNEENIAIGTFFYVFISVLNLFIVSVFWSFLLELFNSGQAKRLFGFIAAGGTTGALIGPLTTDFVVHTIGNSGVLFVGAFMFMLTIFFQRALITIWNKQDTAAPTQSEGGEPLRVRGDRPIGGNPFAGLIRVFTTPYLLAIASFVFLLAMINTFLYFEQLRLVQEAFANTADRTRVFARLDWVVQSLTVVCQIFLTGRIASKLGLTVLLVIVPCLMIGGFLALAATGTLAVLIVVFVTRRVGEYAFVRPAREMLFSRLDNETRYKSKNVIDVPVYRFADAVAGKTSTGLDSIGWSPATVAVLGAGLAVAWAVNGLYLGRKADNSDAEARAREAAPSHGH